jgi:hypothetical protein
MMSEFAKTPYEAGYVAGVTDDIAMDDFDMSMRHKEFIIGYIVGHSVSESVRVASPRFGAWTAGELGYRYNVPLKTLMPHLGFDAELREAFRQAYHDAAERTEEDGESTAFGS